MTYTDGEQKGLCFIDFPFHDSSDFLSDMSRKGELALTALKFIPLSYYVLGLGELSNLNGCVYFMIPKVREPVVCPNQHVFCSNCMDLWLRTHSFCPTCRTSITAENPCKKILGEERSIFVVFVIQHWCCLHKGNNTVASGFPIFLELVNFEQI